MSRSNHYNIPMILNDWNTGRTASEIARIYGFSSANACCDRISKWRAEGWPFQKKTEEKQMTQSEEITAGCIKGSENDG